VGFVVNYCQVAVKKDRQFFGRNHHLLASCTFVAHQYIMVQPLEQKVSYTAEPVEKVPMANSDYFCTVKNQQLTGYRKSKNAPI
jgi:hypothetical protein